mmetsp:Transcript_134296/g.199858  ORF Transcript_134296/g.199858 Transcript_134296/m.199858 type:complete len:333 (+) Transcript_134296:175-1173(+)|eukprot:CAMPEP_0116997442 /NCGR_PEP_ID=MMETSP0472-20121206/878_1 /TAXON_ID=693140 ORGANISM="Tiarina fusus, Strain LIS" /NCGR_SAMPLE_ID=MMETSP0472 /ASSEMBLY_ACC=CAM_ASM_000603 /LENGTH=332 /DNA_ID=CAMNT_0004696327 /DNA_START=113 /DNA_END=1111 /DNA_ORIENTATION=-
MSSGSSSILQLGLQSFHDLGIEFLATVLGSGPTGQTSVICGLNDGSLQTAFFLNPYEPEACAGSDWVVIALLAVIAHAVSWLPRWYIYEPLANFRMKEHKLWNEQEAKRFSQSCTSALFFTLSAFFASCILLPKDWLFERSAWPERGPLIDADYKFYYLLYAGRFCSDCVSLFYEERKQDAFIAALLHHLVTLGLVLGSANVGHIRYGGIIMFFFDWADIPLLSAKICKYLSKSPDDLFQFTANRLFEFFAVLYFCTRNCYYNYVVYAAWADLSSDWVNRGCQYLLLLLVVLQTYWLILIIRVAIRQAENNGNAADIRDEPAEGLKTAKKVQ